MFTLGVGGPVGVPILMFFLKSIRIINRLNVIFVFYYDDLFILVGNNLLQSDRYVGTINNKKKSRFHVRNQADTW